MHYRLPLPAAWRLVSLWMLAYSMTSPNSASASDASSPGAGHSLDVRVTVSVSGHLVTLTCDVTGSRAGSDDHKVQFFCPALPSSVQCFGDCSPICTMQTDGSCRPMEPLLLPTAGGAVACASSVDPPDRKRVSLTIDTRRDRLAGPWRCKFRGASSATVTLAAATAAAEEAAGGDEAGSPNRVAAAASVTTRPQPPDLAGPALSGPSATASPWDPDSFGLGVWNRGLDTGRRQPADFGTPAQGFGRDHQGLASLARADYIIGVLSIMSVSLLLNLGFCIRCILARHYVESRKRSQRKPLDWLGSCLCVSTVQVSLDADGAAEVEGDDLRGSRRRRHRDVVGDEAGDRLRSRQLPGRHCLYCARLDCRVLSEEPPADCGCGGCGVGSGRGTFRLPPFFEEHRQMSEEDEAAAAAAAASCQGGGGFVAAGESQAGSSADSDCSAGGAAGSRLELSRRMLRKADSLLREANSLLLEAEPATDQQSEQ